MEISEARERDGLWHAAVHPGHADILLGAIDHRWPFVLIETWDGIPGWHEAIVSIGIDDEPRPRLVRRHSFDLLVSPAEAAEIGRRLRKQGLGGGGFLCHQFQQRPKATFWLPERPRPRADAMRGQGVELTIDLPHDTEVAVVSSPVKANVDAFASRLA